MQLRLWCLAWRAVALITAVSEAAGPSPAKSKTLIFDVVFSPFSPVAANNVRNPDSPFALGDEIVFHDQLFSGQAEHVGDEVGSCVLVWSPRTPRWRTAPSSPGCRAVTSPPSSPPSQVQPRQELALTGGPAPYRNAGGDGTLVEFGNGKGKLTLHALSLFPEAGEPDTAVTGIQPREGMSMLPLPVLSGGGATPPAARTRKLQPWPRRPGKPEVNVRRSQTSL